MPACLAGGRRGTIRGSRTSCRWTPCSFSPTGRRRREGRVRARGSAGTVLRSGPGVPGTGGEGGQGARVDDEAKVARGMALGDGAGALERDPPLLRHAIIEAARGVARE